MHIFDLSIRLFTLDDYLLPEAEAEAEEKDTLSISLL